MKIELNAIGKILSPFTTLNDMPIQPKGGKDIIGKAIIDDKYANGLKDLDGFNYIYLIYYLHEVKNERLTVVPFMEQTDTERGVFSTRSPSRPNKIGLSIVNLISVKDNIITFSGNDILDGTPLLDIKPYIKNFDEVYNPTSGWMKSNKQEVSRKKSDDRFID